jgi:hypothetical protein
VSAGFIRSFGFGSRRRPLTAAELRRSTLGSEHNREYTSAGFIRSFWFRLKTIPNHGRQASAFDARKRTQP